MGPETRPQHHPQSEAEAATEIARWRKPFTVASICREDLRGILTEAEIERLSDADMESIAERMGDAYRDSGSYWQSLEIMARFVLEQDTG